MLAGLSAPAVAPANTNGTWVQAGALSAPRTAAFGVRLPDGTALVVGGAGTTTERYHPATNTWTPGPAMGEEHTSATVVTLADGRVLVAGGGTYSEETKTAELLDPQTGTWTPTGAMHATRKFQPGVLLADGRVLVVGNDSDRDPANAAEIWSPQTGEWTPTGPMVAARSGGVVARLANGHVLAAGGWDGKHLASAELYDPTTNTWTPTGSMAERRASGGAATLPDGRVLVAGGGETIDGIPDAHRSAELYDPATGTWTATGSLAAPRGGTPRMSVLPDGRPFISGGFLAVLARDENGALRWVEYRAEDTVEIFDPATGTWWQSPRSGTGRAHHASVALADGTILLAGGTGPRASPLAQAERLYPPGTTPPAPPTAPAPPDGPKPFPQTLPRLSKLPSKLTVDRRGRIAFSVRCTGTTTCRDTLTLKTSKGRRLARKTFEVGANRKAIVRLTLSKSALRSVKRGSTKVMLALATRKQTTKATLTRR